MEDLLADFRESLLSPVKQTSDKTAFNFFHSNSDKATAPVPFNI